MTRIPSEQLDKDSLPYCMTRLEELETLISQSALRQQEAEEELGLAKLALRQARARTYAEVKYLPNKEAREDQMAVLLAEEEIRVIVATAAHRYARETGEDLKAELSSVQSRKNLLQAELQGRRT